jgi:predicted kinase
MIQKIYIMIGLPGSGKSTSAKKKVEETDIVIVSRDSIREMIKGQYCFSPSTEKLVMSITRLAFEEAVSNGFDVIVDETNLTVRMRNRWVSWAKAINKEVKIVFVVFNEMENNLERRMNNPKGTSREEWAKVIEDMKKIFTLPKQDEDFDFIEVIDKNGKTVELELYEN